MGEATAYGRLATSFHARVAFQVVERIVMEQLQDSRPAGPRICLVLWVGEAGRSACLDLEAFFKQLHQPAVLLNGEDLAGLLQEQFGQRPQAGANLQHAICLGQLGGCDDAPQLIRVMQKALPQRPGQPDVVCRQKLSHFRECHAVLPM